MLFHQNPIYTISAFWVIFPRKLDCERYKFEMDANGSRDDSRNNFPAI